MLLFSVVFACFLSVILNAMLCCKVRAYANELALWEKASIGMIGTTTTRRNS